MLETDLLMAQLAFTKGFADVYGCSEHPAYVFLPKHHPENSFKNWNAERIDSVSTDGSYKRINIARYNQEDQKSIQVGMHFSDTAPSVGDLTDLFGEEGDIYLLNTALGEDERYGEQQRVDSVLREDKETQASDLEPKVGFFTILAPNLVVAEIYSRMLVNLARRIYFAVKEE